MLASIFCIVLIQFAAAETIETKALPHIQQDIQTAEPNHFSGEATFARLPILPSQGDVSPAIVYFTPNAFTNWHIHKQGQYLIVTEGTGRFQEWGKPIQIITKGDVVWIAPNVKHWHGAGEFTAMSHIAISPSDDNVVTWLEKVQPEKGTKEIQNNKISENGFTAKQISIFSLSIAVAQGEQPAVKKAIEQALQENITVSELKESISHLFSYIGAPKTLNGMTTLKAVIEDRSQQGIHDPEGYEATDLGNVDYYQLGTQKLAQLTQRSTQTPMFKFAPALDYSLKAQLFGYQFSRDNLDDVERELTTIGSLVGLGKSVNAQLKSHLTIMRNLGLSQDSFEQILDVVDLKQSDNLRLVWRLANE